MWLWPSSGMGYRDSQVEAESLFATIEKDPLPGTFPGCLPSALVEGGMEWEGRRKRQMPQPLWMLHEDLDSFWPAPHPILCFSCHPGLGNNGSSLSFLSLDSHFQISALEARYPPEDFYIELRHLSRHAEPHSPGQTPTLPSTLRADCSTPHPCPRGAFP